MQTECVICNQPKSQYGTNNKQSNADKTQITIWNKQCRQDTNHDMEQATNNADKTQITIWNK